MFCRPSEKNMREPGSILGEEPTSHLMPCAAWGGGEDFTRWLEHVMFCSRNCCELLVRGNGGLERNTPASAVLFPSASRGASCCLQKEGSASRRHLALSEATSFFILFFTCFSRWNPHTHHVFISFVKFYHHHHHPHLLLFAYALYIYKRICLRADRQAGNIIVL